MKNLEEIKMLHESAMEFIDMAEVAKSKKNAALHLEYLKKAFILEKEAALRMQEEPAENKWRFILLNSAGWMAFNCGLFEEVENLIRLSYSNNPTGLYLKQLEELKEKSKSSFAEYPGKKVLGQLHLLGTLAAADVDTGKLKIRKNGEHKYQDINASKDIIQDTARYFIGEIVEIYAREEKNGVIILETIKRAA